MNNGILQKCKLAPKLETDEEVVTHLGIRIGNTARSNAILVLTNKRILMRPKKGRKVPDKYESKANYEVRLKNIQKVRKVGTLTKDLEIEAKGRVYRVTDIPSSGKIVEEIVERADLKKSEWGKESKGKKAAKGILGSLAAVLGIGGGVIAAIFGLILIVLGFVLTLTIIGAIIGIPLIIIGISVTAGSGMFVGGGAKGGGWGFKRKEEWVREEVKSKKEEEGEISKEEFKRKKKLLEGT